MLSKIFQLMNFDSSARRRTLSRGFLSGIESLEDRTLLAATASLIDGKLKIEGSGSDDSVDVAENDSDEVVVTIISEGETNTYAFAKADVRRIDFRGKDGNDTFVNNTDIRARAFGGRGDDTLTGGSGRDVLRGNHGNDILLGEGGGDRLRGGHGNDEIYGGVGNDRISGNRGNDLLLGEAGRDILNGGLGNDILAGGADRDRLIDRWGRNKLYQGDLPDDGGSDPGTTAGLSLRRGRLLIKGTEAADDVIISENGNSEIEVSLTTNGETTLHTFSRTRVRFILFNGLGGEDTFTNNTDIPSRVRGSD